MIHIIIVFKTTVHSFGGVVRKSVSSNFPDRWCCPEKCPQQVPRSVVLSGKVPPVGSQIGGVVRKSASSTLLISGGVVRKNP